MLVSAASTTTQQKGYEEEESEIWSVSFFFVFQIPEGRRNKAAETEEDKIILSLHWSIML